MKKKNKPKKVINIISLFLLIFVLLFLLYFKKFFNFEKLKNFKNIVLSAGFWSYLVFSTFQFLQVTIIPLPASITTLAGVLIFGPFTTFLLSTLSIILGSIFAYYLGKFLGNKLLKKFFDRKKLEIIENKLQKGNFIFFLMMLFPFFPDDILCLGAGIVNMDFKFFLITNIITRTLGLFCLCFLENQISKIDSPFLIIIFLIIIIIVLLIKTLKKNKKMVN